MSEVSQIEAMLGRVIFDATGYGWQVRSVVRSMQSDARYVTIKLGKTSIVVRIAKHPKNTGNWDWQVLTMRDAKALCESVLKPKIVKNKVSDE